MRAIGFHWHAVQRDLLVLGFRAADMFTPRLSAGEVVSIIVAAPQGSAVRYSFDEGYTISDHLLATLSEQQAGLIQLPGRYARPGVAVTAPPRESSINGVPADVVSIADFEKRRANLMKRAKG